MKLKLKADGRHFKLREDIDTFLAEESNRTGKTMTQIVETALEMFMSFVPKRKDSALRQALAIAHHKNNSPATARRRA